MNIKKASDGMLIKKLKQMEHDKIDSIRKAHIKGQLKKRGLK